MEMNCSLGFFFYSMSTYYAQLSQFSCLSRTFSALTLNRSITIVPQLGFASFALCNSEITHSHRPKTVKCSSCRWTQEPLQQICLLYVFFRREVLFLLPLLHTYTTVRLLGSTAVVLIWFSRLCWAVHVQQLRLSLFLSSDPLPFTTAVMVQTQTDTLSCILLTETPLPAYDTLLEVFFCSASCFHVPVVQTALINWQHRAVVVGKLVIWLLTCW